MSARPNKSRGFSIAKLLQNWGAHVAIGDDPHGCWLWTGAKYRRGYGNCSWRDESGKHNASAHRVAFELFRGFVPRDLSVLHRCDVPACVNPDHLWLGTKRENSIDMAAKGRAPAQVHPHKYKRGRPGPRIPNPQRKAV